MPPFFGPPTFGTYPPFDPTLPGATPGGWLPFGSYSPPAWLVYSPALAGLGYPTPVLWHP